MRYLAILLFLFGILSVNLSLGQDVDDILIWGERDLEWKSLLKIKAFQKHSEAMNFLKKDFGVTHGFANTIVALSKAEKKSNDGLVEGQYKGKEALSPIYKAPLSYCASLGDDITVPPKKGPVSIIRKRQFALINPATKTRIDLGLKIKDKPTGDRLENSGPFGTMCTHRVKVLEIVEVDEELRAWLKEAY